MCRPSTSKTGRGAAGAAAGGVCTGVVASISVSPAAGQHDLAQAVRHEVARHHEQGDGAGGEEQRPGRDGEEKARLVDLQPPVGRGRLQINEARNFFAIAPWTLLFPACTIALLVVSTNLMSDGLRQVMLPGGGRN